MPLEFSTVRPKLRSSTWRATREPRAMQGIRLPLVGNVFSVYDLSDDNFALSSDYDLLYTELTGATVLYIGEYGV